MKPLPLEDLFTDVLGKAMRGLGMDVDAVSQGSGVSAEKIWSVLSGAVDRDVLNKMAPVLGLAAGPLVDLAEATYTPAPVEVPGVEGFNTPYGDMTVNSFVVWDAATGEAGIFDTGADADPLLHFLKEQHLQPVGLFLTHSHGDHILELDRIKEKTGIQAFLGSKEPAVEGTEPFEAGREWTIGSLRMQTRLTWGHAQGGITYVIEGLSRPVAIVGDALFAASMGGGMVSYPDALRTTAREILSLPDHAVIAPGHGPMTTVGEEKRHNPFFPMSAQPIF